jgi:hypothetical protein
MVESDPADEWGEYAGEHYVTRGVRAAGEKIQGQHEGGNPGVVCDVTAGQTCEVTATFDRTRPTRLGGLPIYSVRYRTRVSEVDEFRVDDP